MVDDILWKVEHLLSVKQTKHARALLSEYLAEAPNDATALFYLARAAVIEGELDEGRSHLEHSLRLEPQAQGARALLFGIELEQEQYPAAEELVIGLIRDNPREPDYLSMYAELMLVTGHLKKSAELVTEALRLDPEHGQALRITVFLDTVSARYSAAEHTLANLIQENPEDQQIAHTLFYSLIQRSRIKEAERVGRELLRVDPKNRALVNTLIELRVSSHPAGLLLYPIRKWGWFASGLMWLVAIVGGQLLLRVNPFLALVCAVSYLGFVAYSWLYPPLMRRWLRARGF